MHERTERRSPTRRSYRLKKPLRCAQCGDPSNPDARGWRGGRIDEPATDDLPAVAFYCSECWQAEFA
jgi:hypothetical protein